jgi:integrase
MARPKKQIKEKEPVRMRFKDLADGNQSIYLDTYKDGKRSYEFLKLYLVPGNSPEAKAMNENTMRVAGNIKAQRIIELQNEAAGISNSPNRSKMRLVDWMRTCIEHKRKNGSKTSYENLEKATSRLIDYKGESITMKEVDKDFCIGFIEHLKHAKTKCAMRGSKPKDETTSTKKKKKRTPDKKAEPTTIKPATAKTYAVAFGYALNRAVKKDIILFNPMTKMEEDEKIKVPESIVKYLTVDEVGMLIDTPCKSEQVKQAYLFSCCCGLRLSDIEKLTWGDIEWDGTQYKAKKVMQKTQKALYTTLPKEAMKWVPERNGAKDTDKVFHLPCRAYLGEILQQWAPSAGITKHVTYHTSRHTFGTLMETLSNDVQITKAAMGHAKIETTLKYSKVVGSKLSEAVNRINGLWDKEPVEVEDVK